jgi:hypothetical protein
MSELVKRRPPLILKEYGRNIQKVVAYLNTISDKEARTKYAYATIELMKQINPSIKESLPGENSQKLWDDLYIMSDFKLDVDGPFPPPAIDTLYKKPMKIGYNLHKIKYKHYGQNILLMIKKAVETEDDEERDNLTLFIGKLMKSFYGTWNKENVDDSVIAENIKELSNGRLTVDINKVKENHLFDSAQKEKPRSSRPAQKKPFISNKDRGRRKS